MKTFLRFRDGDRGGVIARDPTGVIIFPDRGYAPAPGTEGWHEIRYRDDYRVGWARPCAPVVTSFIIERRFPIVCESCDEAARHDPQYYPRPGPSPKAADAPASIVSYAVDWIGCVYHCAKHGPKAVTSEDPAIIPCFAYTRPQDEHWSDHVQQAILSAERDGLTTGSLDVTAPLKWFMSNHCRGGVRHWKEYDLIVPAMFSFLQGRLSAHDHYHVRFGKTPQVASLTVHKVDGQVATIPLADRKRKEFMRVTDEGVREFGTLTGQLQRRIERLARYGRLY